MANQPNIARVLVQLDALLDTRLSTLTRIDPDKIEALVQAGYHTREFDFFTGYDTQQFKEMYAQRDKSTLMESIETKMFLFLRQLVDALDEQTLLRPYHTGVEIVVNTHPYVLDESDMVTVKETVAYWTKNLATVNVITISDEDLTPEVCKANYSAMIRYDYTEWLAMHVEAMSRTRLIELTLYVPDIFKMADEQNFKDDLERHIRTSAHPRQALEWLSKMLIHIQLVSADMFSFADINTLAYSSTPPDVDGRVEEQVE